MIYYSSPYKQFFKAFIRAIRTFISSLFSKRLLIIIIIALFIMLLHLNVHAVTYTSDIDDQIINWEKNNQDNFILMCIPAFVNNTSAWNNQIKVIFDTIIHNEADLAVTWKTNNGLNAIHTVYLYYSTANYTDIQSSWGSDIDNSRQPVMVRRFSHSTKYTFTHNISNNAITTNIDYPVEIDVQHPILRYKSELLQNFIAVYEGYNLNGHEYNYTQILNMLSNYLNNIDTNTDNIESQLNSILSILNTISNKTENDYTDQITGITNQVNSVSSSIQSQTQQQHQDAQATQNAINNQTQQQHQDAQATQNTIEESTNSILSTQADDITMDDFGVQSPTIEGSPDLTNIFNLIYNSFMSVYEDDIYRIQFKLPRGDTTFNYDISANALRSKLPDGLIVLISVFWWVVLGGAVIRFIVKIIHQIVTYSNGSIDGSNGGFLSELTMTPTEFVLFNILH